MSKYDHIEISGMPSWETMNKYLSDELSEEDKKAFEEKISDDPMLADAMEGLAETSDLPAAKAAITRIRRASELRMTAVAAKKREKLIKRQSRVSPSDYTKYMVAAAAAIAFLVLSVYIILDFQKTNKQSSGDLFASKNESPRIESELADNISANEEKDEEIVNNNSQAIENNKAEERSTESQEENLNKDIESLSGLSASGNQPIVSKRSRTRKDAAPVAKSKILSNNSSSSTTPVGGSAPVFSDEVFSEEIAESIPTDLAAPSPVPPGFSDSLGKEGEIASDELIASIPLDDQEDDLRQSKADQSIRNQDELRSREGVVLSEVEVNRAKPSKPRKNKTDDFTVSYSAPAKSVSTYDPKEGQLAKGVAIADLLIMAQENYETEQYPEAQALLQEVLISEPENLVANYYLGSIYRLTGEPKLAISNLKKIASHPESPLFEDGQWELAQAYVARNKNKSSRELLEKIIAQKGKYQLAAQKLLNELE